MNPDTELDSTLRHTQFYFVHSLTCDNTFLSLVLLLLFVLFLFLLLFLLVSLFVRNRSELILCPSVSFT